MIFCNDLGLDITRMCDDGDCDICVTTRNLSFYLLESFNCIMFDAHQLSDQSAVNIYIFNIIVIIYSRLLIEKWNDISRTGSRGTERSFYLHFFVAIFADVSAQ